MALARRVRPVEFAIVETMARIGEPLSAVLITEALDRPDFDLATVNRGLRRLREAGAVVFVEVAKGKRAESMRLYELPAGGDRDVADAGMLDASEGSAESWGAGSQERDSVASADL
jgi:hypothetical protein